MYYFLVNQPKYTRYTELCSNPDLVVISNLTTLKRAGFFNNINDFYKNFNSNRYDILEYQESTPYFLAYVSNFILEKSIPLNNHNISSFLKSYLSTVWFGGDLDRKLHTHLDLLKNDFGNFDILLHKYILNQDISELAKNNPKIFSTDDTTSDFIEWIKSAKNNIDFFHNLNISKNYNIDLQPFCKERILKLNKDIKIYLELQNKIIVPQHKKIFGPFSEELSYFARKRINEKDFSVETLFFQFLNYFNIKSFFELGSFGIGLKPEKNYILGFGIQDLVSSYFYPSLKEKNNFIFNIVAEFKSDDLKVKCVLSNSSEIRFIERLKYDFLSFIPNDLRYVVASSTDYHFNAKPGLINLIPDESFKKYRYFLTGLNRGTKDDFYEMLYNIFNNRHIVKYNNEIQNILLGIIPNYMSFELVVPLYKEVFEKINFSSYFEFKYKSPFLTSKPEVTTEKVLKFFSNLYPVTYDSDTSLIGLKPKFLDKYGRIPILLQTSDNINTYSSLFNSIIYPRLEEEKTIVIDYKENCKNNLDLKFECDMHYREFLPNSKQFRVFASKKLKLFQNLLFDSGQYKIDKEEKKGMYFTFKAFDLIDYCKNLSIDLNYLTSNINNKKEYITKAIYLPRIHYINGYDFGKIDFKHEDLHVIKKELLGKVKDVDQFATQIAKWSFQKFKNLKQKYKFSTNIDSPFGLIGAELNTLYMIDKNYGKHFFIPALVDYIILKNFTDDKLVLSDFNSENFESNANQYWTKTISIMNPVKSTMFKKIKENIVELEKDFFPPLNRYTYEIYSKFTELLSRRNKFVYKSHDGFLKESIENCFCTFPSFVQSDTLFVTLQGKLDHLVSSIQHLGRPLSFNLFNKDTEKICENLLPRICTYTLVYPLIKYDLKNNFEVLKDFPDIFKTFVNKKNKKYLSLNPNIIKDLETFNIKRPNNQIGIKFLQYFKEYIVPKFFDETSVDLDRETYEYVSHKNTIYKLGNYETSEVNLWSILKLSNSEQSKNFLDKFINIYIKPCLLYSSVLNISPYFTLNLLNKPLVDHFQIDLKDDIFVVIEFIRDFNKSLKINFCNDIHINKYDNEFQKILKNTDIYENKHMKDIRNLETLVFENINLEIQKQMESFKIYIDNDKTSSQHLIKISNLILEKIFDKKFFEIEKTISNIEVFLNSNLIEENLKTAISHIKSSNNYKIQLEKTKHYLVPKFKKFDIQYEIKDLPGIKLDKNSLSVTDQYEILNDIGYFDNLNTYIRNINHCISEKFKNRYSNNIYFKFERNFNLLNKFGIIDNLAFDCSIYSNIDILKFENIIYKLKENIKLSFNFKFNIMGYILYV